MNIIVRKPAKTEFEEIYKIIEPYAIDGLILKRSRKDIIKNIHNFFIAENNKEIIGIISYYDYGKDLKEIRSLAVKKEYSGQGVGTALLNVLIENLCLDFPKARIFVLSYNPEFFEKFGFYGVTMDTLPEKIWKDCKNCPNRDNCGEQALIFKK